MFLMLFSAPPAVAATAPAPSLPSPKAPAAVAATAPAPSLPSPKLFPAPHPVASATGAGRSYTPYVLPTYFVPPSESPSLLPNFSSLLTGHMEYSDTRSKFFVRTELADLKKFFQTEFAANRQFMRDQTALIHLSFAAELKKYHAPKP